MGARPSSKKLNELFSAYSANKDANAADALLWAVFDKAAWVLGDEDEAQDFMIGVWQVIKPADFHIDLKFSQWLRTRLRWQEAKMYHARVNRIEIPVSHLGDAEDQTHPEDRLDDLYYKHHKEDVDYTKALSELDPLFQKVAGLLLAGFTQAETADLLGITQKALEIRLERKREKERGFSSR